jgi:2-isopropylmalate synthase
MSADNALRALPSSVEIFDTTLRDGAQFEGISLTVDDKLRVAEQLEYLGVRWIEGGYPQANPKDAEFFKRAPQELKLSTAELVAFGSTRRPAGKVDVDPTLAALIQAGTSTACIVGKSWDFHVV